ncbi:L-aminoadipate-semialdehyde dehydrogenase large subunit [Rhizoctonia solani]|uniref:L-aminoadipate-semialdehyde dehydrogenase large subunit n=1 Tax=Rhizoctonia solani TaxID=456999 RepID=A0A0K6GCH2_9AGAM|nr:L-aminoadipate-semialdehyde dehydrogenase large subunit [Rhizoctonia solani]
MEILRPYIKRANQISATHSRLDERAIVFVNPTRPLPRTPKGTIPRSAALKLYSLEIEEMYATIEQDAGADTLSEVQPPEVWTHFDIVSAWISGRIKDILGWDIDTTVDLFQRGMDSLTGTMLLRDLKAALHASHDPKLQAYARTLNQTVIFDNPTVQQLALFLVQHIASPNVPNSRPATVLDNIRSMIQKYDSNWPQHPRISSIRRPHILGERIVITGTAGALGSHLLAQLLANDRIERVWALNRRSGGDIRDKQRLSFEDKMLDLKLLSNEKLIFVEAALEDAKLGLSENLYDEIQNTATIIIHVELLNAWQVNFNLALQSFEPNIRGTRNLLDLAFGSTASIGFPRFALASSVSVVGSSGLGGQLSEGSVRLEDAASTIGYGQSKLVAEKLLESARRAGLQTCIIRLGQLTGDIASGSWNTTDWVPAMLVSSLSVRCLPAAVGTVSWLPLNIAAGVIIDTCTTRDELPSVIHASHPHPIPWLDIMSAFSDVLAARVGSSLPVVEFGEWNKAVTDSAASFQGSDVDRYKRFPSAKIQSTMDGMAHADQLLRSRDGTEGIDSAGTVHLMTTRAEQMSEGLRSTPKLGREHVEKSHRSLA